MAEFGLDKQFHEFMVEKFDEFGVEEHMQNLPLLQHVKQWVFDNIKDFDDWGDIVECPQFCYHPQLDDEDEDEKELVYDGGHDWDDLNDNPLADLRF